MPAAAVNTSPYPKTTRPSPPSSIQQPKTIAATPQYQGLLDFFNQNQNVTGQLQAQQGIQGLMGQIPGLEAGYQQQAGYTQQTAGLQQQQLGLQGQQLGIQAGALGREQTLLPQQYGVQQAGFNIQQGALERQKSLDPQLQALTEQSFAQQHKDIQAGFRQQGRGLESAGTAGGGLFSHGQADQRAYMGEQHQSALAGLATGKKSEELGYREQLKSLQDQFKGLGVQRVGAALSFQESMAQLQDQKKNLGILQSQLGLSQQEITSRTQQALSQLGIAEKVDVGQAYSAMTQLAQGEVSGPMAQLGAQLLTQLKTGTLGKTGP